MDLLGEFISAHRFLNHTSVRGDICYCGWNSHDVPWGYHVAEQIRREDLLASSKAGEVSVFVVMTVNKISGVFDVSSACFTNADDAFKFVDELPKQIMGFVNPVRVVVSPVDGKTKS